jgi:hypothetical protein
MRPHRHLPVAALCGAVTRQHRHLCATREPSAGTRTTTGHIATKHPAPPASRTALRSPSASRTAAPLSLASRRAAALTIGFPQRFAHHRPRAPPLRAPPASHRRSAYRWARAQQLPHPRPPAHAHSRFPHHRPRAQPLPSPPASRTRAQPLPSQPASRTAASLPHGPGRSGGQRVSRRRVALSQRPDTAAVLPHAAFLTTGVAHGSVPRAAISGPAVQGDATRRPWAGACPLGDVRAHVTAGFGRCASLAGGGVHGRARPGVRRGSARRLAPIATGRSAEAAVSRRRSCQHAGAIGVCSATFAHVRTSWVDQRAPPSGGEQRRGPRPGPAAPVRKGRSIPEHTGHPAMSPCALRVPRVTAGAGAPGPGGESVQAIEFDRGRPSQGRASTEPYKTCQN